MVGGEHFQGLELHSGNLPAGGSADSGTLGFYPCLALPSPPLALRRHLGIAWHNKPQEICPGTGRYIVKLHTHFYPYSAFCLLQKLPIRGGLFIKNPTDIKGLLPYNPKHIDIANGYPSSKV